MALVILGYFSYTCYTCKFCIIELIFFFFAENIVLHILNINTKLILSTCVAVANENFLVCFF